MQSTGSYRMTVRQGPVQGKVFELAKDVLTIGRDVNNDLTINDAEVSRNHGRLTSQSGGYLIEDLASTNGTFVNGQRLIGPKLLNPVLRGKAVVVYGSRFTGERRNMLFLHWVGNRLLSLVTNVLYNTTLSDMETCYKLFDRSVLDDIQLRAQRFEFEPEVTAKILRRGIRIYEVPISYTGREVNEGKKITWRDGFVALWTLVKYRFVD